MGKPAVEVPRDAGSQLEERLKLIARDVVRLALDERALTVGVVSSWLCRSEDDIEVTVKVRQLTPKSKTILVVLDEVRRPPGRSVFAEIRFVRRIMAALARLRD